MDASIASCCPLVSAADMRRRVRREVGQVVVALANVRNCLAISELAMKEGCSPSDALRQLIGQLEQSMKAVQSAGSLEKWVAARDSSLDVIRTSRDLALSLLKELESNQIRPEAYAAQKGYSGFINQTFSDDSGTLEIDVLVYYEWVDYSPGDRVTPGYGGFAEIADIKVVQVRYCNEQGDLIPLEQFHQDLVWQLADRQWSGLEEACTEAGNRAGAGRSHPLHFSGSSGIPAQPSDEWRMAPSARDRAHESRKRKLG